MNQLLGIRVSRTGRIAAPSSHVVWAGCSEAVRERHKQFIRERVHNPEYDGELSMDDVTSPVIVADIGNYQLGDGRIVEIVQLRDHTAFGYILRRNKAGKLKHDKLFHCYINGEGTGISGRLRIVGKAIAPGLH